jgi:hypothetical protein
MTNTEKEVRKLLEKGQLNIAARRIELLPKEKQKKYSKILVQKRLESL